MPYAALFLLVLGAALAVEALYRWLNLLEMSWSWLGYRVAVLSFLMLSTRWFSQRAARREARVGRSTDGFVMSLCTTIFGGVGAALWAWKTVDAFRTGRVLAAANPSIYTFWSTNPSGFAVAVGIGILGFLFFLTFFAVGLLMIWNCRRARRFLQP
jgi:threonine/homoserine/homoserine lactone efflux protein